jgi:hypothetical protein
MQDNVPYVAINKMNVRRGVRAGIHDASSQAAIEIITDHYQGFPCEFLVQQSSDHGSHKCENA